MYVADIEPSRVSSPTEPKLEVTNTTAQTVMTLCNCDYVPVNDSGPKPLDSRGIQTSLTDLSSVGTGVNKQLFHDKQIESVSKAVSCDIQRTSSFKERKRKSTENLIESKVVKLRESNSDPDKEEKKVRRISYTEWLQREPKPLEVMTGEALPVSTSIEKLPAKDQTTINSSHYALPKRQRSCGEDNLPDSADTFSKPPQLPHSPIIRSKNPRKMKAAVQHIYADSRTWKATPPRRMIRHRRPDRLECDHQSRTAPASTDLSDGYVLSVRERTSSDGASRGPPDRPHNTTFQPVASRQQQLLSVDYSENHSLGVKDMVSKYEQSSSPSQGGGGNFLRKSSSPITVSPVRGLKSAAELMRESGERRRRSSVASSHENGSGSWNSLHARPMSSGSSDKENDRIEAGEEKSSSSPRSAHSPVSYDSQKQYSPGGGKGKSLLKDRTNSKQKQTFLEEGRTSSTTTRLSLKDQADDNEIWKKPESAKHSSKNMSGSPSQKSDKSSRKSPSQSEKSKHRSSAGSHGDDSSGGGSWFSRPRSPALFKKSTNSARSSGGSQNSGTISALCMQAMTVSVDDPDVQPDIPPVPQPHSTTSEGSSSGTPSAAGTPERRKGKGRFLDGNWLQKPKRFFKVSK